MKQLIERGDVRYAWLGITTQTVTPRMAEHFGYGAGRGAAVQEVVDESPADRAGLRGGGEEAVFEGLPLRPGGDLIVAIDGAPVDSADDVVRAVAQKLRPGQRARLTVVRGGEHVRSRRRRSASARPSRRPPAASAPTLAAWSSRATISSCSGTTSS